MVKLGFSEISEICQYLEDKLETDGIDSLKLNFFVNNKDELKMIDEDLYFRSNPDNKMEDFEPSDNTIDIKFKKIEISISIKDDKQTKISDNNNKK
jgi:hypothetical protein